MWNRIIRFLITALGIYSSVIAIFTAVPGYAEVPSSCLFIDAVEVPEGPQVPEGPSVRSRCAEISHSLFAENTMVLNLFPDSNFTVIKDRVISRTAGDYSWFGKIAEPDDGEAIFVINGDRVTGLITANSRRYRVHPLNDHTHVILEADMGDLVPESQPLPAGPASAPTEPVPGPAGDDGSFIDVLVVYTQAVAAAHSNIVSDIQAAVDEANASYVNSGISQQLRLVHTAQVTYAESGNLETDITRLQGTSDGYMDNVHTLRNTYCADLVCLWVNTGGCGIAYLLDGNAPSWGFSVVVWSCAMTNRTFAHELGHNMGAHHDRETASVPPNPWFDYSYGYISPDDNWRTIMAYPNPCSNCPRLNYWSNPNKNYGGYPMGIAEGNPDAADNRKTLNNTAYTISNFRESCDATSTPTPPVPPTATPTPSPTPSPSPSPSPSPVSTLTPIATYTPPPTATSIPTCPFTAAQIQQVSALYQAPLYITFKFENNSDQNVSFNFWQFTLDLSYYLPSRMLTKIEFRSGSDPFTIKWTGAVTPATAIYWTSAGTAKAIDPSFEIRFTFNTGSSMKIPQTLQYILGPTCNNNWLGIRGITLINAPAPTPTPTINYSATPAPHTSTPVLTTTPVSTITPMPTPTFTFTPLYSYTFTNTPTRTPTRTITPTFSITPTPSNTPTFTPVTPPPNVVNFKLCPGLNMISKPFFNTETSTADSLLDNICNSGDADSMWIYNCSTKMFQSWTFLDPGAGWTCYTGMPFWVNIANPAGCIWKADGAVDTSINYTLCVGLNMVSRPVYSTSISSAEDALLDVPNCTAVYQFLKSVSCLNPPSFQGFFTLSSPGENFTLMPAHSFWVSVTTSGTWSPPTY